MGIRMQPEQHYLMAVHRPLVMRTITGRTLSLSPNEIFRNVLLIQIHEKTKEDPITRYEVLAKIDGEVWRLLFTEDQVEFRYQAIIDECISTRRTQTAKVEEEVSSADRASR